MSRKHFYSKRNLNIYNTPLETGLRILIILEELKRKQVDVNRLIIYDYLVTHASDFDKSLKSLHPSLPHRSGEIIIKRKVIQEGIKLMYSKELLDINYTENGIFYSANELTTAFLDYFETYYSKMLREYSNLVVSKFNKFSDEELSDFVNENLNKWGSEFTKESLIRGVVW